MKQFKKLLVDRNASFHLPLKTQLKIDENTINKYNLKKSLGGCVHLKHYVD
jgi:hypothetical protein